MKLAFFCSSKQDLVPLFKDKIKDLISKLEDSSLFTAFVYGGGDVGLMGLVREFSTLPVIGHNMYRWNPIPGEFVYGTLRERQAALIDGADAYMILAGGVGTLYELFQVLCENDVEKKEKPVFVYDPDHVYTPLKDLLQSMHMNRYISLPPAVTFIHSIDELPNVLSQKIKSKTDLNA